MTAPVIRVEGVGKRFARFHPRRPRSLLQLISALARWREPVDYFWALRDVGVDVRPGEMLGIIGRNGSGKSTLLRIIGGVMRPDAGAVHTQGRIGGLLQLGTGFHTDLTGRENVFTSGIIAGLTREEVAARFDDIVAFAELADFIDNPLRTFSTGMRMRLGFAVAIHTDPDVLLIDEVLTVGDLAFQRKCLDRIARHRERGCAIVLVSHSLGEVEQHCDRVLWLHEGAVAAHGEPEVVIGQYNAFMLQETRARTPAGAPDRRTPDGHLLRVNENRFGSMEMEIEAVRLWQADGRPADEIEAGAALTVEIQYHAPRPIPAPHVSVAISDEQRADYLDVNTDHDRASLPELVGRGTLLLHLDRLDLNEGSYFVDVGVYERDWTYAYDYHWHVYPLRVAAGNRSSGALAPPRRWTIGEYADTEAGGGARRDLA